MLEESSVLLLLTSWFYHLCFQGDQQSWQYRTLLKAIKIHSFRKIPQYLLSAGVFILPLAWDREKENHLCWWW